MQNPQRRLSPSRRRTPSNQKAKNISEAKVLAKKILQKYDKDRNGIIDQNQVLTMILDAYKNVDPQYKPSKVEIESYRNMLDKNRDGKVTLEDLEDICTRFLVQKM